jgi:hypothetical protein
MLRKERLQTVKELHCANLRCLTGRVLFTMNIQYLFHLMPNMILNGVAVLFLRGEDMEAYGRPQRTPRL